MMIFPRLSIMAIFMLLATVFATAQEHKRSREEMRREILEFKMKFLAQEMELKADQQQKFFDLYSRMEEEKFKAFHDACKMERELKKKKDASEAEYQAAHEAMERSKEKIAEIEKHYDRQFAEFLTRKQIFKMKEAEDKFRMKMREMRGKRHRGQR